MRNWLARSPCRYARIPYLGIRKYTLQIRIKSPAVLVRNVNDVLPNSLTEKEILVEPNFSEAKAYDSFQFVRQGYFCVDSHDSKPNALVFNRIVSLKI